MSDHWGPQTEFADISSKPALMELGSTSRAVGISSMNLQSLPALQVAQGKVLTRSWTLVGKSEETGIR